MSQTYFDVRKLDGTVVHRSVGYRKLKLLEHSSSFMTERRFGAPPMTKVTGLRTEN